MSDRELQPVLQLYNGVSRVNDLDDVRRYKRQLRQERGLNPSGFVPADAPIGAKMVHRQAEDLKELGAIAGAEASSLSDDSWIDLVSPRSSLEENKQTLFENGGALPEEQRVEQQYRQYDDAVEAAEQDAFNYLLSIGEAIGNQTDVPPKDAMETALAGTPPSIPPVDVQRRGSGRTGTTRLTAEQITETVSDIATEFSSGFVEDAIAEVTEEYDRDLEAGAFYDAAADLLENLTGTRPFDPNDALEMIEGLTSRAREQERDELLERFSLAFGTSFATVDDVIDTLQSDLERARGTAIQTADIVLEKRPGESPQLTLDGPDAFDQHREVILSQARETLPVSEYAIDDFERIRVGRAEVVGSRLEEVDFSIGQQRLAPELPEDPDAANVSLADQFAATALQNNDT